MIRDRSAFQWAAIGALLALATGTAAQPPGGLEPLVDETFRYIKAQWPQAKGPVLTDGDIFEVGGGQLRLGRAGLERLLAAPENGSQNVLLTFYAAHEAWHTVQTSTMDETDVQRLRSSRVLECEADYMAATITAGRLKALGASDLERLVAGSALSDYVQAHSSGSANAQYYPSAEMRAQTISFAWSYASNPGLVRWVPDPQSPLRGFNSDPAKVMREICEMAANAHDGSMGNILISKQRMKPPGAEGGEQPVPAETPILSIENLGSDRIVLSYMLVAQGYRRTGAGEKTIHEVYDVVRDQVVVPGRDKVERRYSMKAYAPVGPGSDFHYNVVSTPYATTDSGFTFISARYPPERRETQYCYERINGLDSSSDRALLTRMATVALAAEEDFRPIASKSFVDGPGSNRRFKLLGVLQGDDFDKISVDRSPLSQGALAEIIVYRGKRADVVAELTRIRQVMALVCEMSNVVQETGFAAAPDLPTFSIRRFAPKAFVQLGAHIYGRNVEGAPLAGDGDGIVYFRIARDFSW